MERFIWIIVEQLRSALRFNRLLFKHIYSAVDIFNVSFCYVGFPGVGLVLARARGCLGMPISLALQSLSPGPDAHEIIDGAPDV